MTQSAHTLNIESTHSCIQSAHAISHQTTKNLSCLPINSKQRKIRVVIFMQLINFQSICDLVAIGGQRLRPGEWCSTGYTFLPPMMACVWLANYYLLFINDENAFHSISSHAFMNNFAIEMMTWCVCVWSCGERRYFVGVQSRKICDGEKQTANTYQIIILGQLATHCHHFRWII